MCGRYTVQLAKLDELRGLLGVEAIAIEDWEPRYNVAPGQLAPVVLQRGVRTLDALRWGLVTPWATREKHGPRPINARVETVGRQPMFRKALEKRRCVVPITGYYEWKKISERKKQPWWVHPRSEAVMALAGIYESFANQDGEVIESFAVLTTDASPALVEIHDRMPLELRGEDIERWLAKRVWSSDELAALAVRASDTSHLAWHAVDPAVGSPAVDGPQCIEPVEASAGEGEPDAAGDGGPQLSLFDEAELERGDPVTPARRRRGLVYSSRD